MTVTTYANDINKSMLDIGGFFLFVDIFSKILKIYTIFLYRDT
ncbi:hypothetical protein MWMV2_MWMV2_01646 [Acinetobacter oleivorans]|nr:hypothetical protein MWMV3_MWMV3_01646 [Acinetobacter oleivorans]CAI3131662.1 hypothetical protein MWMV19_MWMV19_01599 [Acinetobacter oleivorans]CAI3132115.1 hypothetical protein MWMV5_MWMV5_01646 [Acinetobacter oleivorans]CAI3132118.1 hypothetical protein MWMV13_MWMV13_01646 [Acinetobacter oleivorans]CAI3132221.1 hypothetical protein MWMV2_MWMV2_01646 [Acinetobacter oleivorans]